MGRVTLLLWPEHGYLNDPAEVNKITDFLIDQHKIKKPVVREVKPRAGARCFEVSDKTVGVVDATLNLIRAVSKPRDCEPHNTDGPQHDYTHKT